MCETTPELVLSSPYRHAQRRLARWLVWMNVAAASRGESIRARIRRLNWKLGANTEKALLRWPASMDFQAVRERRKSA